MSPLPISPVSICIFKTFYCNSNAEPALRMTDLINMEIVLVSFSLYRLRFYNKHITN